MPTRRQFLQSTTGALAAASIPAPARAATSGIDLGFSLYGMKTLPIAEALATCAGIGYRNVEFALNPGFPTEPKILSSADRKAISAKLASLKLALSALMLNMSLTVDDKAHAQNLENIKAAAGLGHDLAPARPPLIESVLGGKPAEWEHIKERMAARLHDWAVTAAEGKVVLAIKAHVGSAVNSPERLLWLLHKVNHPSIQIDYDYSHFQLEGFSLEESLKSLLPYTKFIHVKDSVSEGNKKFHFVLPGEGSTDYVAYFKLLKQLGYTGPVVVEVSAQVFNKQGYDPVAAAKKCYAALSAAMEKAATS